jgi:hypothetical protein
MQSMSQPKCHVYTESIEFRLEENPMAPRRGMKKPPLKVRFCVQKYIIFTTFFETLYLDVYKPE